jgi:hypothetical protein
MFANTQAVSHSTQRSPEHVDRQRVPNEKKAGFSLPILLPHVARAAWHLRLRIASTPR